MGDMSVTCNYSQRRKRKKRRKERYNGVLFFFFQCMCVVVVVRNVCVCVLSGIEDNNTKKIFSPNLFLVCAKFVSQRVF